jgi:O-methyltransferase
MIVENILNFENIKIEHGMNTPEQISALVTQLYSLIENNVDGDAVEFGCFVGESSKYLMKTIVETNSNKNLFVYDSFEGLPDLSKWEENSGWRPRTLKTSEEILIQNFKQNNLPLPIIHKDWFKNVPEYKIPEKICFAFLDGDFYDSIYDSLNKIYDKVVSGGTIFFHDYQRNDLPGVEAAINDFCKERNIENNTVKVAEQLGMFVKTEVSSNQKFVENNEITLVTGIWDIGREGLTEGWSRNYNHYIENFKKILPIECNMIIFGDIDLEDIIYQIRPKHKTQFIQRPTSWFKENGYFDKIQKIRNNPEWKNQSGWLPESTQARLEYYNPLVMSKMFLLHDAKILDKFDSKFLFWIDGGLSNTVHPGYFTHDNVLKKLESKIEKFTFVCFPYKAENEIHGFSYPEINKYAGSDVGLVARGGFFGGPKNSISEVNTIYYSLLNETLDNGLMGTEESIFSIMVYKHSKLINYFEINSDGLLGTFFEGLKSETIEVKSQVDPNIIVKEKNIDKTSLYVIGFNSPKQLSTLIQSMIEYDENFIKRPKKYLLNNSTDRTTDDGYQELCDAYNFEIIGNGENLGICGGRQFIAEHFDKTDSEFMFFFEDDMFFYPKRGEVCRNGFNRFIEGLYDKSLRIIQEENFDFLKMNFSEFFGDNSIQWSWYNVPQIVREEYWPNNPKLPQMGLDPNAPKAKYEFVKSLEGIPYVTGEVYYCNWPHIVSKEGNKKMFLDTKWGHPYEQTWMSFMFQEVKKGKLNPGLLLLTPTEHNRFEHYDRELRKES